MSGKIMFSCPVCDVEHELRTAIFVNIHDGFHEVEKRTGILIYWICKICGTRINKIVPVREPFKDAIEASEE